MSERKKDIPGIVNLYFAICNEFIVYSVYSDGDCGYFERKSCKVDKVSLELLRAMHPTHRLGLTKMASHPR